MSDAAQVRKGRRLVRITCDVLLPEHFDAATLDQINVRNVRVDGYSDELLYDLIQVTVQEARVVMADHA